MDENGRGRDLRDVLLVGLLIAVPVIWLLIFLPRIVGATPESQVGLGEVAALVKGGSVRTISVNGDDMTIVLDSGKQLHSRKESGSSLTDTLRNFGVTQQDLAPVDLRVESTGGWDWNGLLVWLLPLGAILLLLVFFSRQTPAQGANDQTLSFLKSRARKIIADRPTVRFDDVAGVDEAKEELQEIVQFLRSPARFVALGARTPKGLLLVGPPGTGKTLLARAVAGEAGVPFFSISGSEFVEMFVGVGASRVRDLFQEAKRHAPCIVFIDEIDAVGRQRGIGLGGGHDEREQTLNQILVEMDGFDKHTNVVIVAATNRPDVLDPALLRPGRFDRRVVLDSPDLVGREAILRIHARGKPLAADVNLQRLAKQTAGFSGADIENVMNEAALLAARRSKRVIDNGDLEEAIDRVMAGPVRRSRLMTAREKAITAYHESGHALVAHLLPNVDPVHKITIVPRGMSGGHTRLLPSNDRRLWTQSQLADTLAFALGGMAAETFVFGETTTGPGSDLEQATSMARKMVCEYGMSRELGPVVLSGHDGTTFGVERTYSDQTATVIDREVRELVQSALDRARALLEQHRDRLDQLALLLLRRETLQGDELVGALDGRVGPADAGELVGAAEPVRPDELNLPQPTPFPWREQRNLPPKKSA